MNYFKFHPVGQGLFYTGSLAKNTYNFVYDCGSLSKEKYLTDSIEDYVKDIHSAKATKGEIDFVVVSHLHKDHFNGLYYLNSKSKIRTIYLPYLGYDKNMISLILAHEIFYDMKVSVKDGNFQKLYLLYDFMFNLYIRNDVDNEVVFLGTQEGEQQSEIISSYLTLKRVAHVNGKPYWNFLFVNNPIEIDTLFELNEKLENVLKQESVSEIIDLLHTSDGINKIHEIYRKVFSTPKKGRDFLNMTSTVLIHYPVCNNANTFHIDEENILKCVCKDINKRCFDCFSKCANDNFVHSDGFVTILTGDISIDKEMNAFVNARIRDIGSNCSVLQIPHHGAKMAWKSSKIDSSTYVVSFGMGNSYHHPNSDVIESLINTKQTIKLVNQLQSFEYWIY